MRGLIPALPEDTPDRADALSRLGVDALLCLRPTIPVAPHRAGYRVAVATSSVLGIVDYEDGYRLVLFRRAAPLTLELLCPSRS